MRRGEENLSFHWLKVPADWAVQVCKEKSFREAQVLLWIKCRYSNRLHLGPASIGDIGKAIGVSQKTVKRAIANLNKRNWIGINQVWGIAYPRSFETIQLMEEKLSRKAFIFNVSDIKTTKGFLIASAISVYLNRKEYANRNNRRGNRVRHNGVRSIKRGTPAFVSICNLEISKYLSISLSTASVYKTLAVQSGYLKRKRVLEKPTFLTPETRATSGLIQRYCPDLQGKIRFFRGEILIQKPDKVASLLQRGRLKGQKPIINNGVYKGRLISSRTNRKGE